MLQGRFRYLKGLEPSQLLKYNSRLVAFMQELPFQECKPLSPISEEGEGSIGLLEYSHTADNMSHPIYKNINRAIIYAPGSSHAYIQQNRQDITTRISK
jgi:hypothetical protein